MLYTQYFLFDYPFSNYRFPAGDNVAASLFNFAFNINIKTPSTELYLVYSELNEPRAQNK